MSGIRIPVGDTGLDFKIKLIAPQSNIDIAETLREAANRLVYPDGQSKGENWWCASFAVDEVETEMGYAPNDGPAFRLVKEWFFVDWHIRSAMEIDDDVLRQEVRFDMLHLLARMAETCEHVL